MLVDEDVTQVPVAEAQNITRDGCGGNAARIRERLLDPGLGRSILLFEKVMKCRSHTFATLEENFQLHLDKYRKRKF